MFYMTKGGNSPFVFLCTYGYMRFSSLSNPNGIIQIYILHQIQ